MQIIAIITSMFWCNYDTEIKWCPICQNVNWSINLSFFANLVTMSSCLADNYEHKVESQRRTSSIRWFVSFHLLFVFVSSKFKLFGNKFCYTIIRLLYNRKRLFCVFRIPMYCIGVGTDPLVSCWGRGKSQFVNTVW